jgi:hypothetical protein
MFLRNEMAPSAREMAKEIETNRALRAQVGRLQIGVQFEVGKRAHEATMERRYPFFHAPVEYKRMKCRFKEGNSIPYPHMSEVWD